MLKFIDLFSGIGGMALGLERSKFFEVVSFCEIDYFRTRILRKHWPGSIPIYGDVRDRTKSDFPKADWIVGGPPCHHVSVAAAIHGGYTGETLWPEMARLIEEIKPKGVIVEQPNKHKAWKAAVTRDLEGLGFAVSQYVIEASEVGAIHSRERVFFVAHRYGKRLALPGGPKPPEIATYARLAATGSHWSKIKPGVLRVDDGLPSGVDRRARIMAAGSSCVPQVAEALGFMIGNSFNR
jgi:DNA (cytosine-5)-methyltransferase 1